MSQLPPITISTH